MRTPGARPINAHGARSRAEAHSCDPRGCLLLDGDGHVAVDGPSSASGLVDGLVPVLGRPVALVLRSGEPSEARSTSSCGGGVLDARGAHGRTQAGRGEAPVRGPGLGSAE